MSKRLQNPRQSSLFANGVNLSSNEVQPPTQGGGVSYANNNGGGGNYNNTNNQQQQQQLRGQTSAASLASTIDDRPPHQQQQQRQQQQQQSAPPPSQGKPKTRIAGPPRTSSAPSPADVQRFQREFQQQQQQQALPLSPNPGYGGRQGGGGGGAPSPLISGGGPGGIQNGGNLQYQDQNSLLDPRQQQGQQQRPSPTSAGGLGQRQQPQMSPSVGGFDRQRNQQLQQQQQQFPGQRPSSPSLGSGQTNNIGYSNLNGMPGSASSPAIGSAGQQPGNNINSNGFNNNQRVLPGNNGRLSPQQFRTEEFTVQSAAGRSPSRGERDNGAYSRNDSILSPVATNPNPNFKLEREKQQPQPITIKNPATTRIVKGETSPTSSGSPDIQGPQNPKGKSIQALLKNLETKSKTELLTIAKKMVSEINVKNRIINESKSNEKWLMAELAVAQENPKKKGSGGAPVTELQAKFSRASISPEDKDFLQTLMAFKAELATAKKQVEEHEVSLLILEKKRTAAEEEAAYLRTITDPKLVDSSTVQGQRIQELDSQLNETIQDYTVLQSKVSQWARASKRNQEGRISAEAVQKILEEENAIVKAKLETSIANETSLRLQIANLTDSFRSNGAGDKDLQVISLQTMLAGAEGQINELQGSLEDSRALLRNSENQREAEVSELGERRSELTDLVESLRVRNQELQDSVGSRNEYQEIIKKRASHQYKSDRPPSSVPPPVSVKNSGLEREYNFLQEKYADLESQNNDLQLLEQELRQDLENAEKKYQKLHATLEDQDELLHTVKQVEMDKKTLQNAYDVALDKIQQKQIAIEMLQKNMDRARDKMEPLQKSVENMDDMQDAIEQGKFEKEELLDKITELESDNASQQEKIIALMEKLGNSDVAFVDHSTSSAIQNLQERLTEYRQMNEMLTLQLEEKSQDVEMLESRLNSAGKDIQDAVAKQGYSLAAKPRMLADPGTPVDFDDYQDTHNELVKATSTLAEQMITIQNLEEIVSEDNTLIEKLQAEKSKLNQKVSLMQQIKAEYDHQTAEYEKLLEKFQEADNQLQSSEARHTSIVEEMKNRNEQEISQLLAEIEDLRKSAGNVSDISETRFQTLESTISALEIKQAALKNENQLLSEQLEGNAGADTDSYITRIAQLESVLNGFAAQKEQMQLQIQTYREIEQDLMEETAHRQDLEQKLHVVDQEVDFIQSEFDQKVQQVITLEDTVAQLKAQVLERQPSSNTLSLPPKDDLLSRSQDELARLVSQLDSAEVEIEELKAKLQESPNNSSAGTQQGDPVIVNDHYQISLHQQELENKQREIDSLNEEREDLKRQIDELSSNQTLVSSLQDELKTVTEERNSLLSELALSGTSGDMEAQILKLESEKKAEQVYHSQEIESLQDEIGTLNDRIQSLSSTTSDSTSSDALKKRIVEKDWELERLEGHLSSITLKLQELESDSAVDKSKLENALLEKQEEIARLEDEIVLSHDHIRGLEATSLQLAGPSSQRVQELEAELEHKNQHLESLKDQMKLQDRRMSIKEDDSSLQRELEEKTLQLNSLETQIEHLTGQVGTLTLENQSFVEKVEKLEISIKDLRAELDYQQSIVEDTLKQLDEYEAELITLRNNSSVSDNHQATLEALHQKLAHSEDELRHLREHFKSEEQDSSATSKHAEELQQMNDQLLNKIASLSQQMAMQDNNRMSINPAMALNVQLDSTRRDLSNLQSQLTEALNKVAQYSNEKESLLDELDDLRDYNAVLQKSLAK